MTLLDLFKRKKKKEDVLDCDLNSILSLECMQVNPKYIHEITRILHEISKDYSESNIPPNVFDSVNTLYERQATHRRKFEKELKFALLDFATAHSIKCEIHISTDLAILTEHYKDYLNVL